MNNFDMISKMNEYMFKLSSQMSNWMKHKLPKLTNTKDWWETLVFNNLTTLQREQVVAKDIRNLEGLDLAALLRVCDRNW